MNVSSGPAAVYDVIPELRRLRDEMLYGDVWLQPELSLRDRSLVTCCVLAALGRDEELRFHIGKARENGLTPDEMRGLAVQVALYAGWPAGLSVGRAALPFLREEATRASD